MVVLLAKSRQKVVNGGGGDRGCFGFFTGVVWLIDGGRCLGFDGRRFMIRLVVVASGSMTENESKHLGRWPRAEAFVSVRLRFFF